MINKRIVYFMRHGESIDQSEGISNRDNTPLSEKGRLQVRESARILAAKARVDLIISSPLNRAYQTAEIAADELAYPKAAIEVSELLVERDFGFLNGGKSLRQYLSDNDITYRDLDLQEGIEPLSEVYTRASKILDATKGRRFNTILIVGHGIFGRALKRVSLGLTFDGEYASSYNYLSEYLENAQVIELFKNSRLRGTSNGESFRRRNNQGIW